MKKEYKVGENVVCINNDGGYDLTIGKTYKVRRFDRYGVSDYISVLNDIGVECTALVSRFQPEVLGLEQQIEKARKLIGKRVYYSNLDSEINRRLIVGRVNVFLDTEQCVNSLCRDSFEGDFLVAVSGNGRTVPLSRILEKPTKKQVKLNGDYTAIVSKDQIKVGCQTFPVSILEELRKALKEIS